MLYERRVGTQDLLDRSGMQHDGLGRAAEALES